MRKASSNPLAWFAKADADIHAAELVVGDEALSEIVCFHAQQCAEKYLKGYLVSQQIPFKFVHELVYLVGLCVGVDVEFKSLLDSAAELQDYATNVRYPSEEFDPLTLEEAQEALERAKLIQQFVLEKMESIDSSAS